MNKKKLVKLFIYGSSIISIMFFLLPFIALFMKSKFEFINFINDTTVTESVMLSIKSTFLSMIIVTIFGIPTAYILSRKEFRGKKIIELIMDLPMVLPPSVAGLLLLITFGRNGIIGIILNKFSIQIPFTFVAVLIAQIFVAMPFFVRAVRVGMDSIDSDIEIAAELLGDSKEEIFLKIIIPLCKNNIIAGMILAWARALGEFGATMMFAGNIMGKTQTLPLAIYISMENNLQIALALSTLLIIVCIIIILFIAFITSKRGYNND